MDESLRDAEPVSNAANGFRVGGHLLGSSVQATDRLGDARKVNHSAE
jgi:hypothetical protein